MKKNEEKYYVTLTVATILTLLVLLTWWYSSNSMSAKCNLNKIELVDVSPNLCWDRDFASEMCPIPKQIDCSAEIKGTMMYNILEIISKI